MRTRRRRGTPRVPAEDPDFNRALEAMTAPELRTFVRGVLDGLDPDARTEIVDTLNHRLVPHFDGLERLCPRLCPPDRRKRVDFLSISMKADS